MSIDLYIVTRFNEPMVRTLETKDRYARCEAQRLLGEPKFNDLRKWPQFARQGYRCRKVRLVEVK